MKKIFSIALFMAAFAVGSQAQEKQTTDPSKQTDQSRQKVKKESRKHAREELNLSDTQKKEMKAVNTAFKTEAKTIKDNTSLTEEQKKQQLKALHVKRSEKVKAILTPEQQQKIALDKKTRKKQHRNRSTK